MEEKNKTPLVLIVDDVDINRHLLTAMIEEMGYNSKTAGNVPEAIELIKEELPQLILLDIVMPEIDGYQMCEIVKSNPHTRQIPIIFVSAVNDIEDKQKAYELGAVDFIHKPFEYSEVYMRVNIHLKLYKMQQQLEENNRRMNKVISEQKQILEEEQRRFFKTIARIAQTNAYIGEENHIKNVCKNARLLAQALNFTDRYENKISSYFVEYIEMAAAVHDIGKLTIPENIIKKPTPLTPEEYEIFYTHTIKGEEILKPAYPEKNNNFIQIVFDVIRHHHENWDGTGHPDGLKGEEIPLAARILRIVDSYDSCLGERCYKPALPKEEALEKMRQNSGKRYDPYLLDVFFKIEKQLTK